MTNGFSRIPIFRTAVMLGFVGIMIDTTHDWDDNSMNEQGCADNDEGDKRE